MRTEKWQDVRRQKGRRGDETRQDKTKKEWWRVRAISACIDSALGQCVQTHTLKAKQADYKITYSPSHKHNVLRQVVALHLQFNEMT